MGGKLSDLAGGHEGADRHKAAVAWGKSGTQPEVAEQDVGRVLHDAREGCAELLADPVGSACLLGLVERKQRRRHGGEPIGPGVAAVEDILRSGRCRHGVRPARVEGKMGDDLRDLGRLDAIVERPLELVRQIGGLVASDHRRQGDDAAVAGAEPGAPPQIGKRPLRIFFERRRGLADGIERVGVQHGLGLLRLGRKRSHQAERQNHGDETFHLNLAGVVSQEDESVRGD
jgi:hypothetical protein